MARIGKAIGGIMMLGWFANLLITPPPVVTTGNPNYDSGAQVGRFMAEAFFCLGGALCIYNAVRDKPKVRPGTSVRPPQSEESRD